jgi:aspartate racemase
LKDAVCLVCSIFSKKENMKTLGILGGLGPESTGYFYLKLVRRFQEVCRPSFNTQYPHILINSIPAPEIFEQEVTDEILSHYKQGLKELETWGADTIVIACNTAHCFYNQLASSVNVPIINIPDLVVSQLNDKKVTKTLILASPNSIKRGLYRVPSMHNVELSEDEVHALGGVINDYNLGRGVSTEIDHFIRKADQDTVVIAGCTEIAEILKSKNALFMNPMDLAIENIVNDWVDDIHQPFSVSKSQIHGKGVFSNKVIEAGERFYRILATQTSPKPIKSWACIGGVWYSDPHVLNWINHSCRPNVRISPNEGAPCLEAILDINVGDEIVCDYCSTEIGGTKVPCSCGESVCRGYFLRIEN